MNNHYLSINLKVFLFGKFPDTVNGPHKIDSGDKAKQSHDVKDDKWTKEVIKVERNSQKNCSNRVENGQNPKLSCV